MKRLLIVFMPLSLNGMAPALMCNSTATIMAIESSKNTVMAHNFAKTMTALGTVLHLKSFIQSPLDASIAYGLDKGVGYTYPKLKDWITWQMSGDIAKLSGKRKELLNKINGSILPMRLEHNELATIEHMLSQKITVAMNEIAHGTKEQADNAMKKIYGERAVYNMQKLSMSHVKPAINSLEVLLAEKIYTERFNVEPQFNMVMTPMSATYDLVSETAQEVFADLDISKFNSDDSFVNEIETRVHHLNDMGLFTKKNEINGPSSSERATANTLKILSEITKITERLGQRIKVSTALKIFFKINDALDPFIRFTPLKQNLEYAVYHQRPHLGHKLEVLYRDQIGAFYSLATDIALYVKTEIGSNLKKGGAVIDALGNFTDELDRATDKIYKEHLQKGSNVNK